MNFTKNHKKQKQIMSTIQWTFLRELKTTAQYRKLFGKNRRRRRSKSSYEKNGNWLLRPPYWLDERKIDRQKYRPFIPIDCKPRILFRYLIINKWSVPDVPFKLFALTSFLQWTVLVHPGKRQMIHKAAVVFSLSSMEGSNTTLVRWTMVTFCGVH